MKPHKPKELLPGHAYRLWAPFCACPSGDIVFLTAIEQLKGHRRLVNIEFISTDWLDETWQFYSYADLFKRVHSEAPLAIQ